MPPAPRLPWWNKLALLGWAFWALVTLGLLLALLPIHLRTVLQEPAVRQGYLALWPTFSLRAFGNLVVAARYGGLLVFLAVAALIVWRRPNHPLTLIVALMLVTLPLVFQLGGYSDTWLPYPPAWRPVLNGAYAIVNAAVGGPALLAFCFLFPTGRAEPRWAGWVALGLTLALYALAVVGAIAPALLDESDESWAFNLVFVAVSGLLALALFGQIYRYQRVSSAAERRQTRLVVLGLFIFVVGLGVQVVLGWLGAVVALDPEVIVAGMLLGLLTLVALPASLGVAILRYGLWEIEVIVRRTLIYGVLTALLALAYFGAVVLLQGAVRLFTSQSQSPLVGVVSTLLIAALFGPLRRRVQAFIDRRFYRRKYDAGQIVAAFGEALRHETALDQVTAQLENVAAATVQPSHVTVWLPRGLGAHAAAPAIGRNAPTPPGRR